MNFKEILRYAKKRAVRFVVLPLRFFHTNRSRVLLINDMSPSFSDNLKYIGLELRKRDESITIYYCGHTLNCVDQLKELNITPVIINSIKYFYYGMTSKVIVTNSGGISYLPLKKDQYVINTWHGGGAYKKMGIDMYESSSLFRKDLLLAARETSFYLSTCERFKNAFCKSMLASPDKFWSIGMPRNDMLKRTDDHKRSMIRTKLGLGDSDKLVLFAPTYRKRNDNYFNESIAISYGIDEIKVCEALNSRFGGNWIFAYRFHPCIVNRELVNSQDNVIDLTDYDDMQELLLAADVMINDFSSSMWDYMLTGKPCFIFATDLQHYIETTDLYTPVSEWPFPIANSNQQLIKNILDYNHEEYISNCDNHYRMLGGCESGQATKIVCDRIQCLCLDDNLSVNNEMFVNSRGEF